MGSWDFIGGIGSRHGGRSSGSGTRLREVSDESRGGDRHHFGGFYRYLHFYHLSK